MAEVVYPYLRGFIVPDPEFILARMVSPLPPSANPEPGTVRHSDNRSALVLETSGEQSQAWDAVVTRAGMPGNVALGTLYRPEGDAPSADGDRLWNPPNVLTGVRAFDYKDVGSALDYAGAAVYPDTEDVLVVAASGGRVWDTSAHAWKGTTAAIPDGGQACVILPSGLALIFRFGASLDVDSYDVVTDIEAPYARDAGVPPAGGVLRASAVEQNGNIVLFADDGTDLYQYASSDVGASFTLISQTAVDWDAGATCSLLPSGRIMVCYRNPSNEPAARIIADPFDPFDNAPTQIISGVFDIGPRLTSCTDADGVVYMFARETAQGPKGALVLGFFTEDEGTNWRAFTSPPLNTTDDDSCFLPMAGTRHRGQIAIVGGFVSTGSGGFNFGGFSLLLLLMGGWESNEMDALTSVFGGGTGRIANPVGSGDSEGISWYATDYPETISGVTASGPGGRSMSTSSGGTEYLYISQGTDHQFQWKTLNNSFVGRWEGFIESGGDTGSKRCFIQVDTAQKGFEIWMDKFNGFTVRNHLGALLATVGSYPIDVTNPVQFLMQVAGALDRNLTVLYKRPWETNWTSITATLTGTFGTGVFETGTTSLGTNTLGTNYVWGISDTSSGRNWIVRSGVPGGNWAEPSGKFIGIRPYPLGDLAANGGPTYLRAKDGPGFTGEIQTLALTARAPLHRVFHASSPSPDEPHKTGVETEVIYEFGFDGELHLIGNTTSGGALIAGPTWRTAFLEFFLGAWQTAAVINMAEGAEGLSYLRNGHQIHVNGGTPGARYVRRNEYSGGYFHFDSGHVRKIVSNTEGSLAASGKQARFKFEGDLTGIATSGTAGKLCARSAVMVWHELREAGYVGYRLRIPAQTTAEGSIDTGLFLPGGLVIPGRQHSRGYTRERIPNATVIVDTQGTSRVTKRGRAARRWAIAYADGLVLQTLQGPTPTPDWIAARTGQDPIAVRHDVADLYEGLLEEIGSGAIPLVFLPNIPLSTGALGSGNSYKQIHGHNSHLYCRMGSSVRFEHQEGNEDENEMGRLQVIALNEVT